MILHLRQLRVPRLVTLATLVCSLLMSSGIHRDAVAQTTTDEFGCPQAISAHAGLKFDGAQHRLWYRRFWTGVCDGLPIFSCFAGRPYWTESMHGILRKLPEASRDRVQVRMCSLGRLVGYEWAKDNNIRKIDTRLVSRWIDRLDSASDPVSELEVIENEANQKLAHQHSISEPD